MKGQTRVKYLFLLAVILFLALGYKSVFDRTNRIAVLDSFDNIMSQDTAQIARNTLRGHFFTTKYILPVGYAYFAQVGDHPDFLRYPFIILLYAFLFIFAPISAATIKLFNGFLFLLNGVLLFLLALGLLEQEESPGLTSHWRCALAALTAVFSSFLLQDYLRYSLSDAYEIPTITLLLVLLLVVSRGRSPILAGGLQGLLYLSRPNMAVFLPFIWIVLMARETHLRARLQTTLQFGLSFVLVLSPFLARNLNLTGRLLFSYQQNLELMKNAIAQHTELYNTFSRPPSLFPITRAFLRGLFSKFRAQVGKPLRYALNTEYWLGWLGLVLYIWKFRKQRLLPIALLLAVLTHILFFSLFLQDNRLYVPLFFALSAFGFVGLFYFFAAQLLRFDPALARLTPAHLALFILALAPIATLSAPVQPPNRSARTEPPSLEAVQALVNNEISCVYSNTPFWIPWYADIVAIYQPLDVREMFTEGPQDCSYFLVDTTRTYPHEFLDEFGVLLSEDEGYQLYFLQE